MSERIREIIRNNKAVIIIATLLWLLIAVLLIMPLTWGQYVVDLMGKFDSGEFTEMFMKAATNPLRGFAELFSKHIVGKYLKSLLGFSLVYSIIVIARNYYKCSKA